MHATLATVGVEVGLYWLVVGSSSRASSGVEVPKEIGYELAPVYKIHQPIPQRSYPTKSSHLEGRSGHHLVGVEGGGHPRASKFQ